MVIPIVYRRVLVICNLILEILSFLRLVLVGMWACGHVTHEMSQKVCIRRSPVGTLKSFWSLVAPATLYTLQHLKGPSRNSSSSRCCCSCSRWGLLQAQENRQGQERSRTIGNVFVVI